MVIGRVTRRQQQQRREAAASWQPSLPTLSDVLPGWVIFWSFGVEKLY
jgi:hypothetical protein